MESPEQQALPPSAQLALLHAQAAGTAINGHDATTTKEVAPVNGNVLSSDDPIVINNAAFADPIIAGDNPIPIGSQSPVSVADKPKKTKEKLDLSSESAFPSLSSSAAPRQPALSAWSSGASRVKSTQAPPATPATQRAPAAATAKKASVPPVTDVLDLPAHQQIANLRNKPLGFKGNADVIRQVMSKTGTNIIASTNRSGTTTFLIQGAPTDVDRAKRELVAGLVVKRSVEITVPAAARRFIIGAKGKTLQQIEAKSGVRINFPRKEDDDKSQSEEGTDDDVAVTLLGDAVGIDIAKAEIDKIVEEKTERPVIKVDTIDPNFYLLLAGSQNETFKLFEDQLNVKIQLPPLPVAHGETAISISGDKEKIQVAKQALEERYETLKKICREAFASIPKCKHKYLIGKNGATMKEIFEQTGCSIELPDVNDPSENVTIRGPEDRVKAGFNLVNEKASNVHVKVLDLASVHKHAPNPFQHGKVMLQQLLKKGALKELEAEHKVQIGTPPATDKSVPIEFVSNVEQDASQAYSDAFAVCRKLVPELTSTINIEPHLHRYINTRHARPLQRIKSQYEVEVLFPEEDSELASVTVFSVNDNVESAKDNLAGAIADLEKIVANSSDFVSKTISIPASHHKLISGPRGTTLNALLGPDTSVSVRFGVTSPDAVVLRGLSDEVTKAVTALNKLHDTIQRNEFVETYSTELSIPAAYSAHVIGRSGANITKLQKDLGVKINVRVPPSEETKDNKKDKATASAMKVTIQGVKINVEAAQERIQELVTNLANQVTLKLNVPHAYHRYLIGQNGHYVRRLEEKYNVFIKFPQSSKGEEQNGDSDSIITIRGQKKEASAAKEELQELYEYEKEEQNKRKEEQEKRNQRAAQRKELEKKRTEEKNKN